IRSRHLFLSTQGSLASSQIAAIRIVRRQRRIFDRRGNGRHAVVAAHGCFISSERTFLGDADRAEGWSGSPVLVERVGGWSPQTSSVQGVSLGRVIAR